MPQSYGKLLPKVAAENCSPKLRTKATPQSWSSSKLPCKAAPQSSFLKLLPKAVPLRCSTKLCPKLFSKAAESCSLKLLLPEAASWSGKLSNVTSQNCYPKLPRRCSPKLCPKLFSKAVALKLRFCNPVYQNVSPKPFCKAAPES